jgi:hypothetical protein
MVAIDVAVQRCTATRFSSSRPVRLVDLALLENVRSKQARAERARTDRNLGQFVRRMVVFSRSKKPVKRALFAKHRGTEKKFAGSVAVDAVHREPFSLVIPC